ncbi:MAG: tRNA 2-thiouridine(34) synthase MnmA [Candidatus Omnitrophica bacterium]|nr:tRNA 2-thiouridine(34) synthase MnmA [Candidatus Omnitrophota bacterium]
MSKKVLVAMSGGVDSSVASFLLKENNYEVVGLTMCLGVKTYEQSHVCAERRRERVRCCGPQAIEDAKRVCQQLEIPHYVMDFSKDLEEKVISKFILEYLRGRTPNPCIDCNKFLKFGLLLEKAHAMGFDFLATGHYAKIERNNGNFLLKKAKDRVKDQSYFLYPIKKEELNFILFPLAEFTKEKVREIAHKIGLPVAGKPQSQDICFIQDDYRHFLSQRITNFPSGDIVDKKGNILGKHRGIFFYTIGQRERLGISFSEALYVVGIDPKLNRITVGKKEELFAQGLVAKEINLLVDKLPKKAYAKIRYQHKETVCFLSQEKDKLRVIFKEKKWGISPGQSVVFYSDDIVLGGGVIEEIIW